MSSPVAGDTANRPNVARHVLVCSVATGKIEL
jgi:hypothetical protein